MPIDRNFRNTWNRIGLHNDHSVWQGDDESLVIHGDIVGVDFSLCYCCEKCITTCPVNVFDTFTDELNRSVVDPVNDSDCILCLACEIVCPVDAISIERSGGSEDTLESLLRSSQ